MSGSLEALDRARQEQLEAYRRLAEEGQTPFEETQDRRSITNFFHEHPSDALAVHPRQVAEAEADAIRKGVPTHFQKDGRPVIENSGHLDRYMKAYGFFKRHKRDGL